MVATHRLHSAALGGLVLTLALLASIFVVTPEASARGCGQAAKAEPGKVSNGQMRKAVFCLINKERNQAGIKDLDRDKRLQRAAQRHTEEMDGTGCFSHTCGGEGALDDRLQDVGYLINGLSQWAYGENIAWGARNEGSPKAIVNAWMHSAGHRANILNRDFRELGIGFAVGTPNGGNDPGGLYTADFGLRVG